MIGKGVFEVEADGEKIGFEFGMWASSCTEEVSGLTIFEIFKKIGEGRQRPMIQYFYGGMMAYNEFRGIQKEIKLPDVAKMLEKIGAEKAVQIYLDSIKSYTTKNGKAPKETGQEA